MNSNTHGAELLLPLSGRFKTRQEKTLRKVEEFSNLVNSYAKHCARSSLSLCLAGAEESRVGSGGGGVGGVVSRQLPRC